MFVYLDCGIIPVKHTVSECSLTVSEYSLTVYVQFDYLCSLTVSDFSLTVSECSLTVSECRLNEPC